MKGLALFGLVVLLLIFCFLFVYLFPFLFCVGEQKDKRDKREIACWILIATLIVVISGVIIFPESFGYEKISTVSENAVESEE